MENIILTADKSHMSNYRNNIFFGFIPCMPMSIWTKFFYNHGVKQTYKQAPIGLRCAEAALLEGGKNVKVVHPDLLEKEINKDTKIVGVSVKDPFGVNSVSEMLRMFRTFRSFKKPIKCKETFTTYEFRYLMEKLKVLKKKYHFKIVVGGQGVWQLENRMEEFGIDHIYYGEAEKTFPEFCENSDEFDSVIRSEIPKEDEIPSIKHASTLGAVEISRGCGRGCKFCSVTLTGKMRHIPEEIIFESVRNTVREGQKSISLRSEDFLLYRHKNFIPDDDALLDLIKGIYGIKGVSGASGVHASFASILSNPDLIGKISKFIKIKGGMFGCQPGIETGSDKLLTNLMPGKKFPFKNELWSDIVYEASKILNKNRWYNCSTLIIGLPDEEPDDVKETIDLVRKLKNFKTLITPLIFIPIKTTKLHCSKVIDERLRRLRQQLFNECWKMNLKKFSYYYLETANHSWSSRILYSSAILLFKSIFDIISL